MNIMNTVVPILRDSEQCAVAKSSHKISKNAAVPGALHLTHRSSRAAPLPLDLPTTDADAYSSTDDDDVEGEDAFDEESLSSDASSSGEEEVEEQDIVMTSTGIPRSASADSVRMVRMPSAFSNSLALDRRVSSTSRRSPQRTSTAVNAVIHRRRRLGDLHLANDDISHQPIIRAGKARPTPMVIDTTSLVGCTPRIEIEQVFDEESDEEQSAVIRERSTSASRRVEARSVARTQMMQAIGGRNRASALRRSESMDVVTGREGDDAKPTSCPSPVSAAPRTPGTATFHAHHQRSISCPTPNTPQSHQFGHVQVLVTPPTPRPQGSPIIGVFIRGVHRQTTPGTAPTSPSSASSWSSSTWTSTPTLTPPAFELAPGRTKLMEAQRMQAMAMMAWQQEQQNSFVRQHWATNVLLEQGQQQQKQQHVQKCDRYEDSMMPASSPTLLPGTPGAPSMVHVQEMRTIQRQRRRNNIAAQANVATKSGSATTRVLLYAPVRCASAAEERHSTASAASTWRRAPQPISAPPTSWSGSSASAYSPVSPTTPSSPADAATTWRRRGSQDDSASDSDDSCCANVGMARSDNDSKRTVRPYLPPAKRAATIDVVPAVAGSQPMPPVLHYVKDGVMGRKEGVAAAAAAAAAVVSAQLPSRCLLPVAGETVRSRAAQSMMARIGNRGR